MPNPTAGGALQPSADQTISGTWDFTPAPTVRGSEVLVTTSATQTLTGKTLTSAAFTTPVIDGVTYSAANKRQIITDIVAVSGTALHAANLTLWTAPAKAIILRALFEITTVSTGASTIDIGYTATTATTTSNTLFDGIDGASATGLFDSMDAALASGANAHAQLAASAKWITADEASGDTTGLVGVFTVQYILA